MYYDHYGQGIVNSFSQLGSFSLSSTSTSAFPTIASTPRFSGPQNIPAGTGPPPAASVTYPTAPLGGLNGQNALGVDDHISTPYSYAFNLSIQRQLHGGFMLETAYVGRIGRHLMQQYDW